MSSVFQEVMSVECDNTSLIGLGNVGEDGIDHT